MTALQEEARAKVNLALHVVGRRADGYHALDTLVAFPDVGDTLHARPADRLALTVDGPAAEALADTPPAENLVLRAAEALRALAPGDSRPGAALRLVKRLPVAAGIGGGSADAAAAIRLLCRLWGVPPGDPRLPDLAATLGADVPMCLASRPLRARGAGEAIELLPPFPPLGVVLVNPRVPVATPAVFKGLERRDNPPMPPAVPTGAKNLVDFLASCRNDLQDPAVAIAPVIGAVIEAIGSLPGCRLARMSGSGATCFGLFDDQSAAVAAAQRIAAGRQGWWVAAATLA